jgi:hypothetical protein
MTIMKNNSHVSPIKLKEASSLTVRTNQLLCSISTIAISLAIASAAVAERREVDIRIPINKDEGFTIMTRKAETLARSAAQRTFDRDVLVSGVSVKVTAENKETASLILQLIVSRSDWASRPDPKVWATYFPMAKALIGLQ